MKTEFKKDAIEITCRFGELVDYDYQSMALYATPTTEGRLSCPYWATSPSFRDDEVVATVSDFAEAKGLTSLGWEDLSEEEFDSVQGDLYRLTIPNSVGDDESASLWEAEQTALAAEREACRAK